MKHITTFIKIMTKKDIPKPVGRQIIEKSSIKTNKKIEIPCGPCGKCKLEKIKLNNKDMKKK